MENCIGDFENGKGSCLTKATLNKKRKYLRTRKVKPTSSFFPLCCVQKIVRVRGKIRDRFRAKAKIKEMLKFKVQI